MMRARWSRRLSQAVSIVVLCTLILPPGLVGAVAAPPPAVLTATDSLSAAMALPAVASPNETMSLTETASLTETTPLEEAASLAETVPVTPTDVLTPTEEVAEPVIPIAEPVLPTFESPLPTPPAPATGPELLLTVQGGEEAVQPGDAVALTVTVANTGDAPARGVFVEAALPESLHLTGQRRGWEYDQPVGRLSVQVGDLEPGAQVTLDLALRAKGPLDTLAEVAFEAHTGPAATNVDGTQDTAATPVIAMATILVAHPKIATVERGGGHVVSEDGRVRVDFPPGALDHTREVTVRAARREAMAEATPMGTLLRFSLEPDMQFSTPVTLTLDLSDLTDWERALSDGRVFLNTWDEAQGRWIELPCDFDPDTRLLTARLEHFTNYGAGVDGVKGWQLLFHPVETALFSGAMTYNYPMEVLPGRAGLQPQVNLGYSSRAVDGVIGWVQSDWTGLGWSIDQVDITRIIKHPDDVSRLYQQSEQLETMCRNYYDLCHVNEFNLLINGASYHLVPVNPLQKGGRYYAEGAPALWVYRYNGHAAPESPSNVTGEWWQVKTADGKTYRLGYTTNSEQVVDNVYSYSARAKTDGVMGWFPWDYEWLYAGRAQGDGEGDDWGGTVAYRWRVDAVADTDGNTITYSYFEEKATTQCSYMPPNWDRASYLSQIQYGNATIVFDLGLRHESGIADGIGAAGYCDRRQFFQARYLRKVQVLWGGQLVREYRLGYTQETGDGRTLPTRLLQSVTQYSPAGTALPATTFAYVKLNNQDHFCNYADGCYPDVDGRPQFPYPRVAQVDNGYAGNVHVQYDGGGQIGRAKYARYYYWAKQRTVTPGIGVAGVTAYEFNNRCFRNGENYWNRGCSSDRTAGDFVGWGWAKERYKGDDGVTDVSIVEHTFRLSDSNGMNWLLNGREEQTSYRNGSNTLLRRVDRVWTLDSASGGWARLDQEVSTDYYGGAPVASQKTAYEYAPGAQGNAQYGNITAIYQYGAVDPATRENTAAYQGDERSIHRAYYPNTEKWIVSAIAWENIHEGITPNVPGPQLKTQTINHYDYATAYSTPPTLGHLTKVQRGLSGGPWAITTYIYDTWGNVTSVTDPNTNTSTITYDTTYRMFPLLSCSPYIPNVGQLCTTTEYYGVGGIAADYGLPGQVKRVWDANGVATANEYRYDAFGRLVRVRMPGDAGWEDNQVSRLYKYVSDGLIGKQRIISYQGQNNILWQETYYDGLGRTIQVHQKADNGQEVRTTTQYDALGQAVKTWVPYYGVHGEDGGYGVNGYVPASTSLPHSVTQYDALGQVVRAIAPDGTQTSAISGGRVLMAEDANRHLKLSHNDAFGQLIQVDEALIDWSDAFSDGQLSGWGYAGSVSESGGTMNITGNGAWSTYISKTLASGVNATQGVSYDVKYDPGTILSTIYLSAGTWDQSDYRRWAITVQNGNIYLDRYVGTAATRVTALLFPVKTNVWYRVLLSIGHDGQLVAAVWERDNPAVRSVTKITLNEFANRDWNFFAHVHTGIGRLDNYDELTLPRTTYVYDTLGNLTAVTDALNNVTTMTYDALSRKLTMNDPDMGAWSYQYDNVGNLKTQTDARGCVTTFSYDGLNRLIGKTYSGACSGTAAVAYSYDAFTSGSNYGRGYRTGMTMSDNSSSASWTYDQRGRVTQETKTISGQSFSTGHTYDSIDRVVTTTYPDGEVVRSTYNGAGQPATLRSDTYSYNYVSSANYNALGQITEMNLGNGTLTRWGYQGTGGNWDTPPTAGLTGYGRLYRIRTTAPAGEPWLDLRYGYDAVGNVTRMLDVPRQAANWPTSGFTFQDTFDSKNTTTWTWSVHQTVPYSDGGNNVVRNVGTGSNYDASFYRNAYSLVNGKGLQLRFKVSQTDTTAVFAIEANDSTYRRLGVIANEGKLYVQYRDDGATWRYPADLLTNLQVNTWYVLRIVVDDSGRGFYVEAYQENAPTVRGSYNIGMPTGKTWRFRHWIYRGTAYLDDYREFNTGGLSWTPDERMGFTYDALDRLVSASPVNGGQGYNQSYSYNQIGNLMTRDAFAYTYNAPTPGSGCAAGTPNTKPHAVQSVSSLGSFTYDCNGNMLTRVENGVSYSQSWNQENRLQTVTVNGATTTFTYDGDGNLVKKTVSGSGGYTTYYVGPHYEKNVTANVVTKYYYFGSQRVAMRKDGALTYLHGDHLGSASLATNASGGRIANSDTRYYPYGEARPGLEGTALPTDRRFTGQRREIGLGLYDYNARFYDPLLGRFLSADSLVPSPTNPQTLNRYAYTLNNPLKHTDPTGHSAKATEGDKPWWVPDAFGIRFELSIAPLSFIGDALTAATSETVVGAAAIWVVTHVAIDVNYDMVFSLYDQETGELGFPRLSEIQDRIDVFQTKGGQFATEGGGVSIGGLALYNVKNNDVLEGMQFEIAGTTKTPVGLEVGAFTDLSQSSLPLCFYGGVGFGVEATPLSATVGKSENITDRFWNFLDRLSNAYQRLTDQPQ